MKKFIPILILIFVCQDFLAFSRAGGGGGGGSVYGRGIDVIIGFINIGLIAFLVYRKNKKAKKLIEEIHLKDSGWDYDKMIAFTNEVFTKLQTAWTERNMDLVKDIVTEKLYLDYQKQLNWQKVKHEQNIVEDIDIKKQK